MPCGPAQYLRYKVCDTSVNHDREENSTEAEGQILPAARSTVSRSLSSSTLGGSFWP